MLEAAGLKPPHTVAAVASILDLARNGDPPFVKGILPVSEARPGDLVTFGGTEHVAVVVKVDSAEFDTIAGNTSQSNVSRNDLLPELGDRSWSGPTLCWGRPGSDPRRLWNYAGVPARWPGEPQGRCGGLPATPRGGTVRGGTAPRSRRCRSGGGARSGAAAGEQRGTDARCGPARRRRRFPIAFKRPAPAPHGPARNTVQFLPAVQPLSPGSPSVQAPPRWRSARPRRLSPPILRSGWKAGGRPRVVVGQPPAAVGEGGAPKLRGGARAGRRQRRPGQLDLGLDRRC